MRPFTKKINQKMFSNDFSQKSHYCDYFSFKGEYRQLLISSIITIALTFLSFSDYAQVRGAIEAKPETKKAALSKISCKNYKIAVKQESCGYECCYSFIINNSYTGTDNNLKPKKIRISVSKASFTTCMGSLSGYVRIPSTIPTATQQISWGKIAGFIPSGIPVNLGKIQFGNITSKPFYVVYEWFNSKNTLLCKDSVKIECQQKLTCCAFDIVLVNKLNNTREYSKIKVSTTGTTQIINTDPDEFNEIRNLPNSVDWYLSGSTIPKGEAIEIESMVYLTQAPNQTLQVEWFDLSGHVVCKQLINVPCRGEWGEDEKWGDYTSRTTLDDPNLFVMAVQDEDNDCESDDYFKIVECDFTYKIECYQNTSYKISADGPTGLPYNFNSWKWELYDNNSSTPISNLTGQTPNFTVTTPGSYNIKMTAINTSSGDTCLKTENFIIPGIIPGFDWKQKVISNCTTHIVEFTPDGFDAGDIAVSPIKPFKWECTSVSWSSTEEKPFYDFKVNGTYTIILTITDKYGCSHSVEKDIEVTTDCKPEFHWEYFFCPLGDSLIDVEVTFFNDSKGGCGPYHYTWFFGDNNNSKSILENPKFTYKVNGKIGNTFTVKLSMTDSLYCKNGEVITHVVEVKPCLASFSSTSCPDGRVNFDANEYGEWEFVDGAHHLAPWPYTDWGKKNPNGGKRIHKRVVMRYEASGDYLVQFTSYCDDGGRCTISEKIHVVLECCTKNDFISGTDATFTANKNGKNHYYKLDHKMRQIQLPLVHRIQGKAKLWMMQEAKILGFCIFKYYAGKKADIIQASLTGTVWKRDGSGCNCANSLNITPYSVPQINSVKAKFHYRNLGRYRSKIHSLTGSFYVKQGDYDHTFFLQLGTDCDQFRWWTDWY